MCLPEITPIIMMHTWTYRRNEWVHVSWRSNIGKKKLSACSLLHIAFAFVAECLCHLKAQYLIQSPNICSRKQILLSVHLVSATGWLCFCTLSLKHHTNSFAAVENNFMQSCISLMHIWNSLQPTHTWTKHTNVINKRQVVQQDFTNIIPSFNVAWFKR